MPWIKPPLWQTEEKFAVFKFLRLISQLTHETGIPVSLTSTYWLLPQSIFHSQLQSIVVLQQELWKLVA